MFVHKVLMFYLFFISLNVCIMLKLDGPTEWSWFLVLTPMWLLDFLLLILSLTQILLSTVPVLQSYATNSSSSSGGDVILSKCRAVWFLCFVLCKISFQVLLCLSTDSLMSYMPAAAIMAPLWIVFIGVCVDLGYSSWCVVRPAVQEFVDEKKSEREFKRTKQQGQSNKEDNNTASSEAQLQQQTSNSSTSGSKRKVVSRLASREGNAATPTSGGANQQTPSENNLVDYLVQNSSSSSSGRMLRLRLTNLNTNNNNSEAEQCRSEESTILTSTSVASSSRI